MTVKTDNVVTWVQPTVRRRIRWNLTRRQISLDWQANPKEDYTEVDTLTYSDDASAWHMLLEFMCPNPYIKPQDWHAV